jgi:hypothetical protein
MQTETCGSLGGGVKDAAWARGVVQAVIEAVEGEVSRSGVRAWIADFNIEASRESRPGEGKGVGADLEEMAAAVRLVIAELCGRLSVGGQPPSAGVMALRGVRVSYPAATGHDIKGGPVLGAAQAAGLDIKRAPVWGSAQVAELLAPLLQHVAAARSIHRSAGMPVRASRPGGGACDNLRIRSVRPLLPAAILMEELPRLDVHERVVKHGREQIQQV